MKNEMIKFVSENFKAIKAQFLKDEMNILEEIAEDEGDQYEFDFLVECLNNQLEVDSAEDLIDAINERTIGIDYDDESECIELFNMIKAMKEAAN
jgi:hypothetical protein